MLAVIGASGKIGSATLDALLSYDLYKPEHLVACTSSSPGSDTWLRLEGKGVVVRHATFEDGATIEKALEGCEKLFLVSTPRIELDFNDAPPGTGREKSHLTAIDAARHAGVKHVYYTSLAFGSQSKAGVMRAHIRTEEYLASLKDIQSTILREGLYNESWPLYLGYYDPKADDRDIVILGGDGKASWTAIGDLGLANALVLAVDGASYVGKMLYLSSPPEYARTLSEVSHIVGQARAVNLAVRTTTRQEHEKHYIEERKMDDAAVKWWSTTYDALSHGECYIEKSPLEDLLRSKGRTPKPLAETIVEMVGA